MNVGCAMKSKTVLTLALVLLSSAAVAAASHAPPPKAGYHVIPLVSDQRRGPLPGWLPGIGGDANWRRLSERKHDRGAETYVDKTCHYGPQRRAARGRSYNGGAIGFGGDFGRLGAELGGPGLWSLRSAPGQELRGTGGSRHCRQNSCGRSLPVIRPNKPAVMNQFPSSPKLPNR